jgi:hypothetical protein
LVHNKEKVSKILAEEWKHIRQNEIAKMPAELWQVTDGTKPKRWLTPWLIFIKERKRALMDECPALNFADQMRRIADIWKSLPPNEL